MTVWCAIIILLFYLPTFFKYNFFTAIPKWNGHHRHLVVVKNFANNLQWISFVYFKKLLNFYSRYDWQHGIQSRTWDPLIETRPNPSDNNNRNPIKVVTTDTVPRKTRISLTFRWTRSGPCECVYKTLCDSVNTSTDDIENELASNLEDLHVHQVSFMS